MNGAIKQVFQETTIALHDSVQGLRDKRYGLSNAVMPHREGHYVPSVPDSQSGQKPGRKQKLTDTGYIRVWRPTCVWGVTVWRFGVLVHDVNQDDNQFCQADWIWNRWHDKEVNQCLGSDSKNS